MIWYDIPWDRKTHFTTGFPNLHSFQCFFDGFGSDHQQVVVQVNVPCRSMQCMSTGTLASAPLVPPTQPMVKVYIYMEWYWKCCDYKFRFRSHSIMMATLPQLMAHLLPFFMCFFFHFNYPFFWWVGIEAFTASILQPCILNHNNQSHTILLYTIKTQSTYPVGTHVRLHPYIQNIFSI